MDETYNQKSHRFTTTSKHSTVALIEELQKANSELREARRAALNLMEDTLLSKEALRQSEEKYRTKLEGEVRDRTADLKTSKDLLQATMDASPDMIQVFEAVRNERNEIVDFRYILMNHEAEKWMPDALGGSLLQRQPGVVEEGIFEAFKKVVETGVPQQYEKHYVHEQFNGWYYQSVVKLNDGVATTTANITGRKTAELEVEQSKTLLQDIINAPRIGMAVYKAVRNARGEIIDFVHQYINRASLEMLGGEDFTGRPFTDHGENALVQLPQFIQVIQSGKANSYTREALFRGRTVWFAITNTPLGADRLLHTWQDVTERKQAEAEILRLKDEIAQKATDKYQTIFNSIEEGFLIHEMVRDDTGKAIDFRLMEVNPAFTRQTGLSTDTVGKLASEYLPNLEQFWIDTFDRVARSGTPEQVENYNQATNRWYNVHISKVAGEDGQVAVVFEDITERRNLQQKQDYLLKLSDAIRFIEDAVLIEETITKIALEHFEADRCYYCTVENEIVTINRDARRGNLPSVAGTYPLHSFTLFQKAIDEGRPIIVDDSHTTEILDEELRQIVISLQIRSYILIPVIKKSKAVGLFCLVQSTLRKWKGPELELAIETAERTWAAVERAKAEEALRKSEEKYRSLFDSIDEGFCIVEVILDENGRPYDLLHLEANQAYERYTGLSNIVGKRSREIIPEGGPWMDFYGNVALTGRAARNESYFASPIDRWIAAYAARIGDEGSLKVAIVFNDITERKRREANLAFLAEISLDFAPSLTVNDVMEQVVERLANYFHLSRCHLSIVDEGHDSLKVVYEYRRNKALPSIMGMHHVLDNLTEEGRRHFKAGKLAVVDSAQNSWLRKTPAELLQQFGFGSLLDVPHLEGDRWKFLLTLGRVETGGWRNDEVEMLEELSSKIFARIERARAEEALRNSEERLQSIANLVPDLLWDSEPDGSTTWYNQRWLQYTGQSFEEAAGWGWTQAIHPDDREASVQRYKKAVQNGEMLRQEHRIRRYDGEYRWFVVNTFPHKDESGKVLKMYGASTDIHESRLMNEALRKSEARLRTLADAVPQVIWTNDVAGNANYFNQRWYEFTGLSYHQSEGPGWQAIVHPDDESRSIKKWQHALAKGEAFETEYRLRRKDGSYCWFIGRNVPVKDAAGNVTAWFGSATEIGNLKKTEEALSQSEERLRITMESATDYAIITMDTKRKVERWSKGAEAILGYTEEEMIGQLADIIFTEEDKVKNAPQQEMETARDTGRAPDERWHERKDGSRFFASGVMRPIQNESLTGYVKVLRDTTQERQFTEELHRLVSERTLELQRSNENLQQFATIASHDLQEPLRKLRLFSSVLQRYKEGLPDEGKEVLSKISLTSERMSQLIREVLQYSRLNSGAMDFEPTDLDGILQDVLCDLDLQWKETGAQLDYTKPLPQIKAIPSQMTQLFYNLLTNALKFRRDGVKPVIRISAAPLGAGEKGSFPFLQQDKAYLNITVSDNGIGFDPQFAEQIFQIFERLHSVDEFEGTGVGLALCKKIVENHNGHIFATAKENEGASFHVILPVGGENNRSSNGKR